jgi:hypothetical protein
LRRFGGGSDGFPDRAAFAFLGLGDGGGVMGVVWRSGHGNCDGGGPQRHWCPDPSWL